MPGLALLPILAVAAVTGVPPLSSLHEITRYRVTYGVLGQLGDVTIQLSPGDATDNVGGVQVVGRASGSLLGLGQIDKDINSAFDPGGALTRRWHHRRTEGDRITEDDVDQPRPGTLTLIRRRNGVPGQWHTFARARPVLDPVGFLLRLRLALPEPAGETFDVVDGRALWTMTVQAARAEFLDGPGGQPTLRIDGHAEPLLWDGQPDPDRPARTFTLWLADDTYRTPVRMALPLDVGEVRVDLVSVERRARQAPPFFQRLAVRPWVPWLRAAMHAPPR